MVTANRRSKSVPVMDDFDFFMDMVRQTKAPAVRAFLKKLYQNIPTVFADNGEGVAVTAETLQAIKRGNLLTPEATPPAPPVQETKRLARHASRRKPPARTKHAPSTQGNSPAPIEAAPASSA